MKSTIKTLVSGLVAIACTSLASAAVTYTAGDLVLAFRSSSVNSVFFYNLGSSTSFRDNGNQGLVADLGATLTATYGANWFTSSDLSWGIFANRNNQNPGFPTNAPAVDGDPSRTIYVSRAATDVGDSTAWGTYGSAQVATASTFVKSSAEIFAGFEATSGTNNFGAVVTNAQASQYIDQVSPNSDFGLFGSGIEGSFNTGTEFAYLDLYRILATTNGATPTGTVGLGSLETTFAINSAGQIFSIDASAVPEPSAAAGLAGAAALGMAALRRRRRQA